LAHSKADATRINAQIRQIRAEAEKHPDPLLGAAPLFVSARLESPSKYLDAFEGGRPLADIEGGAARKAVHDENKHRKKIMGEWAPCWLAHLRQWPMEESQQSASGKGIKTTRARKQRSQDCYQKPPKK
jgi:hypothetical protein